MFRLFSRLSRPVTLQRKHLLVPPSAALLSVGMTQCYSTTTVPLVTPPESNRVTLYQYDVCPFCNKVKAYLDFHEIPYEKVEVNPLTKEEIKFSEYRMVPFVMVDDERQINGSKDIIHHLSELYQVQEPVVEDEKLAQDCNKWEQWVDDHLIHILPPNIYRTPGEAIQAFDYITTNSNFVGLWQQFSVRYAGALVMYIIAKRAKTKYNLSDDPRQDLYDAIKDWTENGLANTNQTEKFHGKSKPDMADLAVFGVLRAIDGDVGVSQYDTWDDLKQFEGEHMDKFWTWYHALREVVPAPKLFETDKSASPVE